MKKQKIIMTPASYRYLTSKKLIAKITALKFFQLKKEPIKRRCPQE